MCSAGHLGQAKGSVTMSPAPDKSASDSSGQHIPAPFIPVIYVPDPENPGWHSWDMPDANRFNLQVLGHLIARREDNPAGQFVRLRMIPQMRHSNMLNAVHGAVTMALSDVALFAAFHLLCDGDAAGAVTVDMSHQFIGAGRIDEPLDAVTEVLRETGRLVFLRGTVEHGDNRVAAFSGTIRKPSRR